MFSKDMLKVLDRLKLKLLLSKNLNFISSLLATLDIKDLRDDPNVSKSDNFCNTACVNGTEMLINEDWFIKLTDEQQEMVLLHEVMHIAKLHPIRGRDLEDKQIANIAFDIIVNRDVIGMGYSRKHLKDMGAVVREDLEDKSEEEIYLLLVKNQEQKEKNKNNNKPCNGGIGDTGQGEDEPDDFSLFSNMSNDVIDKSDDEGVKQDIINKVSQAMELAKSRGWGITQGVEETINNILHPCLDWKELLNKYLNDLTPGSVRTWSRPNRRFPDVYRPSKDKERTKIKLIQTYIDSSGSVSDRELQEYLAEIKHIYKKLQPKKLIINEFDTRIIQSVSITDKDAIKHFVFRGRGGTAYEGVMEDIEKTKPQFAIIFTDLFCNIPPKPNTNTHIFWIRTGKYKNGFSMPSYGTVIHYDNLKGGVQ